MLSHPPESIVTLQNRILLIDPLNCSIREVRTLTEVFTPFKSRDFRQSGGINCKFVRLSKQSLLIAREVILAASSISCKR